MYKWRMIAYNPKKEIFVYADSFDEALAKARLISKSFCGGQRAD